MEIYLDNAATTMVCPQAAEAVLAAMTQTYGNPSSTHAMGRQAAKTLENARSQVAKAMGAQTGEIFFTSCGTESINWAITSAARLMQRKGRHIITSAAEHGASLRAVETLEKDGFEVTRLKPQKDGSIAVQDFLDAVRNDTILVSLMLVNNETGAVTDIHEIAAAIKDKACPALLHCDAVQGFLKLPFTAKSLGADLISISGHKIHAPKGVGALYIKGGPKSINLSPLLVGGRQENGRRAGTEALPNIAALGVACEIGMSALAESTEHMNLLREKCVNRLSAEITGLQILSQGAPHILSISMPGFKSEVIMNYLEARGVYISKSSACKKGARSHVLEAAGYPPAVIDGALRIGFSRFTTEAEIDALCDGLFSASKELCTVLR